MRGLRWRRMHWVRTQFRTSTLAVSRARCRRAVHDHTLLPRLLTSLVRQHRVGSFHLTLSSGRWQPTWPLHLPAEVPASGIELTAWLERLEGETDDDERDRWEAFTSAVSGLFCAGIVADGVKTSTSSPTWTVPFDGEGDERGACPPLPRCKTSTDISPLAEYSLYRLTMPRLAAACTESLTPFLSLLPCSYHAGLSSLLNPHRLFDGDFTLIGVRFPLKEAEEKALFELEVGSVLDPVRKDRLTGQLGRRGAFGYVLSLMAVLSSVLCRVLDQQPLRPNARDRLSRRDRLVGGTRHPDTLDQPLLHRAGPCAGSDED